MFDGPGLTGTIGWAYPEGDQTHLEVDFEIDLPPPTGDDTPDHDFPPLFEPDIGRIERSVDLPQPELVDLDCEALGLPRLAPPDPDAVAEMTKGCFGFVPAVSGFHIEVPVGGYEWPATDCDAPCLHPSCEPPDEDAIEDALAQCPVVEVPDGFGLEGDVHLSDATCGLSQDDVDAGVDLIGAGVALLVENEDIVSWLTCLLEAWSPDLESIDLTGCVLALLNGNGAWPPMHVYVFCLFDDAGKTGAAYNLAASNPGPDGWQGPIIPLGHNHWRDAATTFRDGSDEEKLCAAADMAAVLLHEMVHVCGGTSPTVDNPLGATDHKLECDNQGLDREAVPTCCWDECRMIQRSLWWALAQRYPCLTSVADCCDWSEPENFMYSADGGVPGTPCSS